MFISKVTKSNIIFVFFFWVFLAFANICYAEYSVASGDRIIFNITNSNTSFEDMTEIDVIENISVIQGEDFLELEEVIPDTIPVGGSASLIYRVIDGAEDNSKMEINFRLEGSAESSWIPETWEETLVLNYNNTAIPTLSEWKQIFLTLLMSSLVMGFVPARSSRFGLLSSCNVSGIVGLNMITFNKQLFFLVIKWISLAVVLGLISAKVVFGYLSPLDITGTFFCAPLVAYILHLIILFFCDYKVNSEI
jgi:hypothetical protein